MFLCACLLCRLATSYQILQNDLMSGYHSCRGCATLGYFWLKKKRKTCIRFQPDKLQHKCCQQLSKSVRIFVALLIVLTVRRFSRAGLSTMQNMRRIGPPISRGRQIWQEFFFCVVLGVHEMIHTDSTAYILIYCHCNFANLYFKSRSHKVIIIISATLLWILLIHL